MRAPWRQDFDPERDFVVRRKFKMGGKLLSVGEAFDKSQTSTRRLRQLYDQRMIMFSGDAPGALLPAGHDRRGRRLRRAPINAEAMTAPRQRPTIADLARWVLDKATAADAAQTPTISTGAAGDAFASRSAVVIPADWADLSWPKRKALAALVTDEKVSTQADVERAITAELARRGTT